MSSLRKPRSRLFILLALVVVAILSAAARYWYAVKSAPERHFCTALEAFARNDLDHVQVAAEALRDVDGYEPHVRLLSGMVLLRNGHLIDAIVEFGFAREHEDTRALAHTLSGEALYKSGQFEDARRVLAMAIELDPEQTDAHRWIGAMYYDIGAMNHAIRHLLVVAEQAPDDPRPFRLIGLIHKDFEEYSKAINAYRESLARDPAEPLKQEVMLELAECLVKQRQHKEALETIRECPLHAQVLWLRAKCHYEKGDRAAAKGLVDEAVDLDSEHLEALHLKGTLELEAGDAASAVDTLSNVVRLFPKEWRPRYTLARAYRRLGDEDKAAEHLKVMEELRDLRERFTRLHAQAIKDADDANLRYQLGLMASQLDRPLLAAGWFRAVLALDPDHQKAREALLEAEGAKQASETSAEGEG